MLVLREILPDGIRVAADADARDRRRRNALILRAAARYACSSAGELPSASATLSKPNAAVVGRQQRVDVDVEPQQIANRIGIFRAIQPVQDRTSGIRVSERCAHPARPSRDAIRRRRSPLIRPPGALRRHDAELQLADDLFPRIDVGRKHS